VEGSDHGWKGRTVAGRAEKELAESGVEWDLGSDQQVILKLPTSYSNDNIII